MTSLRVGNLGNALSVSGYPGIGVRGDQLAATGSHGAGMLYQHASLPADNAVEFRYEIVSGPTGGASFTALDEDGGYSLSVPGDGVYTWTYNAWAGGTLISGSPFTGTATVGAVGITLSIASATGAAILDSVEITQAHGLSISDAVSAAVLDPAGATQAQVLSIGSLLSGALLGSVEVSAVPVLSVSDVTAGSFLDAVGVTQDHVLSIGDCVAAAVVDSFAVTSDHLLAISAITGDALLDSVSIIQTDPPAPGAGLNEEQAAQLLAIFRVLGLDPDNPLTVTPTSRTAGDIVQQISGDGVNTSVVTRL